MYNKEVQLAKLEGVGIELNDQGYLENVLLSFQTVEAMIREVAQEDPANFSFENVYKSIKQAQK